MSALALGCQFEAPGATGDDPDPQPGEDGGGSDAGGASDAGSGGPGDRDGDSIADPDDNCPDDPNPGQFDEDGDQVGNPCDVCPAAVDDQTDSDGDGVGDACDPQPGVTNTLLMFEGFDGTLDTGVWPEAAEWATENGDLVQADNGQRYWLHYNGIDAADDVLVVARVEYSNPAGPNNISFRFGGVFAEASGGPTNNGCWLIRALAAADEGYSIVNVDDGSVASGSLVGPNLAEDTGYEIALAIDDGTKRCVVSRDGSGPISFSASAPNYGSDDIGLVASFTEMRVRYVYAIRLD